MEMSPIHDQQLDFIQSSFLSSRSYEARVIIQRNLLINKALEVLDPD